MGELALRRIQAGVESTPGVAVLATKRVYGTLEPKRDQPRRWAMEERGVLVSNFRANAKLVDATFVLKSDLLFEDLPFFLEIVNRGGVVPVGTSATGFTYDYTPTITVADLDSNPLKTLTFEWGDEELQWQGPFAQGDALKVEIGTDDPIVFELEGFVQEWWPKFRNNFVPGGDREALTAFTKDIQEHAVEAPNGWQVRLFIDKFDPFDISHNPIGTTYIQSRFVKATAEYKNQNKRKYFGDFAPFYQKIGRGRRDVQLALTLEETPQPGTSYSAGLGGLLQIGDMIDTNQPNFRVPQARIRLQAVGSQIDTSTFGTTNGAMTAGSLVTSPMAVNALTEDIPGGAALILGDHGQIVTVTPDGANAGDTNVPIVPFTPRQTIADASNIYRAKSVEFDFYGALEGDVKWAAHETNVAYDLVLKGVFDIDAGKQDAIYVTNDLSSVTAEDGLTSGATPPDAPTGVTITSASATTATVAWTDGSSDLPIDGFDIRVTDTGDSSIKHYSADAEDVDLLVYGLTTGHEYTAAVRAHSAAGWGEYSTESSPETQP